MNLLRTTPLLSKVDYHEESDLIRHPIDSPLYLKTTLSQVWFN